jgi:glycine oxidase
MQAGFPKLHTADVAIVGGGIIGLAVARALRLRGVRDVVVIEKNKPGREASWAAGGILAPQVEAHEPDHFFRLACAGRDLYRQFAGDLEAESGVQVELDTTGTIYVAFNEADEFDLRRRLEWQQSARLRVEWLNGDEARRLEPYLAPEICSALRFPDDYQIENRKLIDALIVANRKLGVRLIENCEVNRLIVQAGRSTGVETSSGTIDAPVTVLAAGAWSSFIASAERIAVEPIRGQMLCFEAQPQLASHVLYSQRGYLIPRHDGRLLAGSTSEQVGFKKEVTEAGTASIKSMAFEIMPALQELTLVDQWAGFRPRALDGLPVLGPAENIDGLFYATGHYRNGILLAPITAELVSEAIVNCAKPPLLAPFLPARFVPNPAIAGG